MRQQVTSRNGTTTDIHLELVKEIGTGAFGKVRKMKARDEHHDTSKLVAVKNPTATTETRLDITERDLLVKLKHKNIVDLLYYYHDGETVSIVMEFIDGGDLWDYIRDHFSRSRGIGIFAELFTYQMFRGLAYIHSKNVAHRDIKPENLLVNERTGMLKIADFGLGTWMNNSSPHASYVGTRTYRAPEMLLGCRYYSPNIDVWAGGVVLTQILSARPIFYVHKAQTHKDLMTKMFEYLGLPTSSDFDGMKVHPIPLPKFIRRKPLMSVFKDFYVRDPEAVKHLLNHVFRFNIKQRYSAWDVCNHRLFNILQDRSTNLPNGHTLPPLFDFSSEERHSMPEHVLKSLGSVSG